MEEIVKKEFKDLPDETTPFESEWINGFQDKIIANFNEISESLTSINTTLQAINTKLDKTLTYTIVTDSISSN
ncbi:MAG: hypothetical protein MR691_04235 [Clostridium sp.]|nr:hypothetical protein [Clostridium sp.]MDY4997448.1 hypothetical protein [Bacilli bacterium]